MVEVILVSFSLLLEKFRQIVEEEKDDMTVSAMVNSTLWSFVERNVIKGGFLEYTIVSYLFL